MEYDIIGVSETWIQENIYDRELFDDHYSVFRCDRNLGAMSVTRGGGTLLAIRSEYKAVQLDLHHFRNNIVKVDIVGCKVHINHSKILIFVIYIPPNSSHDDYLKLFEAFENLPHIYDSKILIMGDFNLPNLSNPTPNPIDLDVELLRNFLDFHGFNQVNNVLNCNNCLLDLVLSNVICTVHKETSALVPEDIYHPALNIEISFYQNKNESFPVETTQKRYNFRKANFPVLYDHILNVDWSSLNKYTCVNEACDHFYSVLCSIFDNCVPLSIVRKRTFPVWYTRDLINNIKLKYRILKKLKLSKSPHLQEQFKQLRVLIKKQSNLAYETYVSKIQNSILSDPHQFWSFVQSKKGCQAIPNVLSTGERQLTEPEDIVNAFADFFKSVYMPLSDPDYLYNNKLLDTMNNTHITLTALSQEEILKSLRKLKPKMTHGPDDIPSFIIKDCAQAFVTPLYIIFNLALQTNTFPDQWKLAKIKPIFKKGDVSMISNYRSISLLSNFAKTLEMSLYDRIFKEIKQTITPFQHGFFENRSTITNLAIFTHFTSSALDNHLQVDTIYTDFSKAFDRVDHHLLLLKLENLGFDEKLISFFRSYLLKREQYVEYRGHKSFKFIATSGVPQGSNLAPLLFSLFVNDITKSLTSRVLLFADDLKLFKVIHSEMDCLDLQKDLCRLNDWCVYNKLPLNTGKCNVMTFSTKTNKIIYNYTIQSTDINRCTSFKDLGILFDPTLSFSFHIENIAKSSVKMLGFIFRTCSTFTNADSLKILYFSYVRSKLEYGAIIWNPLYKKYINQLENIQRRFAKFLAYKSDGTYPARGIEQSVLLNRFKLDALDQRRTYHGLQFLFKLTRNKIDSIELNAELNIHVPNILTRSPSYYYLPRSNTKLLLKSPIYFICKSYNNISRNVDINHISHRDFTILIKELLFTASI